MSPGPSAAWTPGMASAGSRSMRRTCADACGERSTAVCSIPFSRRSAVYSTSPRSNCLLDLRIRAAAADVAGHRVPDLLAARRGLRVDERDGADDLAGRAEAALERVGTHERIDHRMVAQALDRRHPRAG